MRAGLKGQRYGSLLQEGVSEPTKNGFITLFRLLQGTVHVNISFRAKVLQPLKLSLIQSRNAPSHYH
ncbi:hypothetical protein XELAEV_18010808mg [Xenopus laevis]|uniref:Uncharacterized protein n=1 Tax=Xenopus laevis TaxID=8355 RepID=A0A974I1V0_XENLA|nr:hypothetical protein XELAEV_18010808mg [Xenopus laevis]